MMLVSKQLDLEAVKNARVLDSIKKGEGYAFYCYKPHAIWGI